MPASSPSAPTGPPARGGAAPGPSRARVALVVVGIGAATLAGLLLQGWVSAVLLGIVVLALAAVTLGTWHRLTVPGRALRVLVLGFLAATAVARLPI
jgi:CBS domain containing-hemolysin-like protein